MAPLDILVVVGLRAHAWYICGCWPLCHVFCRFSEPPRAGEVLLKFWVDTNHFCPFYRRTCGRDSATRSSSLVLRVFLHRVDSPLHRLSPPRYPNLTGTLGITPLFVCGLWSRNLVRRLLSERDTVGGMQIFAYLRPYLFQIVHVIWTAHGYVDWLVSMVRSGPRWCFGITPLLFSRYTLSLAGRVSGEQRGGATKILSRIGAEHGN
jgi:hypothetical protein